MEARNAKLSQLGCVLFAILFATGSYAQTDIDFNNLILDPIFKPDSLAKRHNLKAAQEFERWVGGKEIIVSEIFYDKNGFVVKDVRYGANEADSVEKTIEVLPDSFFCVTYKVDPHKQLKRVTFEMYLTEMQSSADKGVAFELRSLYKVNVDSTFEIVTEVNGKRIDSVHYTSYFKELNDYVEVKNDFLRSDTCKVNDTIITITTDSSELNVKKIKKMYYFEGHSIPIKEEYLNYDKEDSLIHHGIVFRQFDPQGRITYYAEQIGGRFWVIEKTEYDASGNTIQRYLGHSSPIEGKEFPDEIYKYDKDGKMLLTAGYSNRIPNIYGETQFIYSKTGLLLKKVLYVNKAFKKETSYKYSYWKK